MQTRGPREAPKLNSLVWAAIYSAGGALLLLIGAVYQYLRPLPHRGRYGWVVLPREAYSQAALYLFGAVALCIMAVIFWRYGNRPSTKYESEEPARIDKAA